MQVQTRDHQIQAALNRAPVQESAQGQSPTAQARAVEAHLAANGVRGAVARVDEKSGVINVKRLLVD